MLTCHSTGMAPASIKGRGGSIQKLKPVAIINYNKYKTGVDHCDQMITYYHFKPLHLYQRKQPLVERAKYVQKNN